ncbi:hypothetical protein FOZ60_009535 [Perkinsus olseni]|uniref:Uncharacterized protein n=1 Tax=Perkinsus olseni TaxID=32597 RepID=A0A7J6NH11_PEROL|nr:hypothetical protein FOZ60_009535 [Perkinsus olseni]
MSLFRIHSVSFPVFNGFLAVCVKQDCQVPFAVIVGWCMGVSMDLDFGMLWSCDTGLVRDHRDVDCGQRQEQLVGGTHASTHLPNRGGGLLVGDCTFSVSSPIAFGLGFIYFTGAKSSR